MTLPSFSLRSHRRVGMGSPWRAACLLLACLLSFNVHSLLGQSSNPAPIEDPEGETGALKAQVTTGGSYSPHSGNATRSVNDLQTPGALGKYGLDLTRYWNSIPNSYSNPFAVLPASFGNSGWTHSWEWHAVYADEGPEQAEDGGEQIWTTSITITFPDGHANHYKITRSNHAHPPAPADGRFGPPYTAAEQNSFLTGGSVYDLLRDMAPDGSQFWLYLADGGAVHFVGTSATWNGQYYTWTYQASEVFDAHGLRTIFHYDANGRLDQITQDGGRSLTIRWDYYSGFVEPVIGLVKVTGASDLQGVAYHYNPSGNFLMLTSVNYPEGATAVYTYGNYYGEDPAEGPYSSTPLLKTANDPRYPGAMTQIFYTYRGGDVCAPLTQGCNCVGRYYRAVPEAIGAEKSLVHLDSTGQQHMTVSSFGINCFAGTRLETSGLGGWRQFYFGNSAGGPGIYSIQAYQLTKLTDFTTASVNPPPASLPFEWQNYKDGQPRQIWDGRDIQTEAIVTPGDASGQPGEIHHVTAGGSYQVFDRVNPGGSDEQNFTAVPNRFNHWLFRHRDERGLETFYSRDSRRRLKRIDYADGSYETFSYKVYANGETYNQVETHRMPSGAIQTYEYNETTHLLVREYNSVDGWAARKEYTYYGAGESGGAAGLVKTMSDGRSRAAGKDFSTRMTYNRRHQVLTVEYAEMFNAQNPTMSYGYDAYGNCTSITDELGHTRVYEYDSYRRCTRYTEPLNALDWKGTGTVASRTWDWIYDRYIPETGQRDASAHTKNEWRVQIEPAFNAAGERKMTARWHDLQNRIIRQETGWIQPPGPIPNPPNWYWSGDGEIHSFTYDKNGQKESDTLHIAPSNRVTTFEYDLRNRLWKTNETVYTLPRTTETLYDVVGNKTQVTFPDGETQRWPAEAYTAFGQPRQFFDERNNLTNLEYWPWGPMKKLASVTTHRQRDNGSPEDQTTRFYFDLMGRPQSTYFPDDSPEASNYEASTYEFGQLKTWKTRKNQTKTIVYDARGREQSHSWNDGITPAISRSWDAANRLASITNIWSSIDFAYDAAGQVIWEGNDIAGSGTRTQTNYFRYPDGSVAHLYYPGGTYLRKDYTARGQLAAVGWDDDGNNWWRKLAAYTYLSDGKVGQIDFGNGVRTGFLYDQRGFPQIIDHYRPGVQDISWRQYWRDDRDRITAFQKSYNPAANPLENGRGDRFDYDDEGQLTDGWYDALDPAGNFHNWTRKDHFSYDAMGNRQGGSNNLASRNAGQSAISFERRDNGLNQYRNWWPAGLDYVIYHDDNYPGWGPLGNGVMMADGWLVASYNALNQPVAMVPFGWSDAIYFGYDALGRCVKRWRGASGDVYSNPATYFHYDGWNLLQEGNNSWGPSRVYVHGNRTDEIVWSSNTFTGEEAFHQYDARGHATLLTDRLGGILEQYEYDAFGQPYFYDAAGNSVGAYDAQGLWAGYSLFGNRFLFTGREWLSDLKLYDYRNRMYQPELGRFMQPDPKHFEGGDYNLYRYCHNDPINKTDPFGLEFSPYTGGPIPIDTIKAGEGLGQSLVDPKVVAVSQGDGTYTLQLNVHVTGIVVAERAKFHGKMIVRSEKEKTQTFEKHEKQEHGKDWKRFHDEKQKEMPTTRYNDRSVAEKDAKTLSEKMKSDAYKANKQFERHQPQKRWKDIRDRELPH